MSVVLQRLRRRPEPRAGWSHLPARAGAPSRAEPAAKGACAATLAPDVLGYAFGFLDPASLRRAGRVSKHWRQVAGQKSVQAATVAALAARPSWDRYALPVPCAAAGAGRRQDFWADTAVALSLKRRLRWPASLPCAYREGHATAAWAPLRMQRVGPVWAVTFLGQRYANGTSPEPEAIGGTCILDVATGVSRVLPALAYLPRIDALALSPDGRWLAYRPDPDAAHSAGAGSIALQYLPDVSRPTQFLRAPPQAPAVAALRFDGSGQRLLVCDGQRVWPVVPCESGFEDDFGPKASWGVGRCLEQGDGQLALDLFAFLSDGAHVPLGGANGHLWVDRKEQVAAILPTLSPGWGPRARITPVRELVAQTPKGYLLEGFAPHSDFSVSADGAAVVGWHNHPGRCHIRVWQKKSPGPGKLTLRKNWRFEPPRDPRHGPQMPVVLRSAAMAADGQHLFAALNTGFVYKINLQAPQWHSASLGPKTPHALPGACLAVFNHKICLTAYDRYNSQFCTYQLEDPEPEVLAQLKLPLMQRLRQAVFSRAGARALGERSAQSLDDVYWQALTQTLAG